jgi:hypothetical protein
MWEFPKEAGGFNQDPFTCARCGSHRLSEPVSQGGGYGQTCLDCGRSRRLDPTHPIFNWFQQQTAYPSQLQELNQGRPMNMFSKVSMPVDPDWWSDKSGQEPDQWYDNSHDPEEVPFRTLYHGTARRHLESILEHGLAPWDHPQVNRHNYHELRDQSTGKAWYTPRPNHTYMTTDLNRATSLGSDGSGETTVLEINPSYLHPENINPDEDHIRHVMERPKATDVDDASLGDYAERIGWGHDKLQESGQEAMVQGGNVAYRGVIPPQAITHVHRMVDGRWTREPVESVQQRIFEQQERLRHHDDAAREHVHMYTHNKESLAKQAWLFRQPVQPPTPEELAHGRTCFFHPDRPAVRAEAGAAMCDMCAENYDRVRTQREQQLGTPRPAF